MAPIFAKYSVTSARTSERADSPSEAERSTQAALAPERAKAVMNSLPRPRAALGGVSWGFGRGAREKGYPVTVTGGVRL